MQMLVNWCLASSPPYWAYPMKVRLCWLRRCWESVNDVLKNHGSRLLLNFSTLIFKRFFQLLVYLITIGISKNEFHWLTYVESSPWITGKRQISLRKRNIFDSAEKLSCQDERQRAVLSSLTLSKLCTTSKFTSKKLLLLLQISTPSLIQIDSTYLPIFWWIQGSKKYQRRWACGQRRAQKLFERAVNDSQKLVPAIKTPNLSFLWLKDTNVHELFLVEHFHQTPEF